MIDYIKGRTIELTPTDMVVECHGIGYRILISLQSYEGFNTKEDVSPINRLIHPLFQKPLSINKDGQAQVPVLFRNPLPYRAQ